MKWLKYTIRTVYTDTDMEGNETEREIFTEAQVPDNEQGRALAEKEAYGEITVEDDGEPEPETPTGDDDDEYADMAAAIREGVNGI